MLESRSAYGYYGEFGGASGEMPPKTHKRGWEFGLYDFKTTEPYTLQIKACDYAHAIKQAKAYAKKSGCEILGVIETFGVSREEKQNIEWYKEELAE